MRNFTWEEVRIILTNMQWMLTSQPGRATFYPDSDTLVYGDGGVGMEVLAEEGFTPATDDGWRRTLQDLADENEGSTLYTMSQRYGDGTLEDLTRPPTRPDPMHRRSAAEDIDGTKGEN